MCASSQANLAGVEGRRPHWFGHPMLGEIIHRNPMQCLIVLITAQRCDEPGITFSILVEGQIGALVIEVSTLPKNLNTIEIPELNFVCQLLHERAIHCCCKFARGRTRRSQPSPALTTVPGGQAETQQSVKG